MCQFFVYLAWLSFGRAAVNPFGDDEDDINIKEILLSHIEVGYLHIISKLKTIFSKEVNSFMTWFL